MLFFNIIISEICNFFQIMLALRALTCRLGQTINKRVPSFLQGLPSTIPSPLLKHSLFESGCRDYHYLSGILTKSLGEVNTVNKGLLEPTSPNLIPVCGFKLKKVLKRRCKDCYMVVRDGRTYIMCPTHGRSVYLILMC